VGTPGTDSFGFQKIKSPDDLRRNFASITIQTTPGEAQAVIDEMPAHPDGNYSILSHNCTTTCRKLLPSIGKPVTHALSPLGFFEIYAEQDGTSTRSCHQKLQYGPELRFSEGQVTIRLSSSSTISTNNTKK
jgi:hypothetical protein